ncbi:MAG: hypothetical protein Q8P44_09020 [Dehalococcoidia bacterium]|nr:hypothetical protein [Dehalococcoidia bacterium]
MEKEIPSLDAFFRGYEQKQIQKQAEQRFPGPEKEPDATDLLNLFAKTGGKDMTVFEITSRLMTYPQRVTQLTLELAEKKLVKVTPGDGGNDLVSLTPRGKVYIES